ncbi:MAG: pectinesterase family protein [Planctomycetota bacterium]
MLTTAVVFLVSLVASASAKTWFVAQDGSGDFVTIQAAVDAAAAGDVIVVRAGTYVESVEVKGKTLTIVGSGIGNTVVASDGQYDYCPIFVSELAAGVVAIGHMTLRGYTCLGFGSVDGAGVASDVELRCAPIGDPLPGIPPSAGGGMRVAITRAQVVDEFPPDGFTVGRPHGAVLLKGGFITISQGSFTGLKGGDGDDAQEPEQGGAGMYIDNTTVYLADVSAQGGLGAPAWVGGIYCDQKWPAQPGGPGLEIVNGGVVIGATHDSVMQFAGGKGGYGGPLSDCGGPTFAGGDGGDGIDALGGQATLHGPFQLVPGSGGDGNPPGKAGLPSKGSVDPSGELFPTLAIYGTGAIGDLLTLQVTGNPGERVLLIAADRFDRMSVAGLDGFPLFAVPGGTFFFVVPIGTISGAGTLAVNLPILDNPMLIGQLALFQAIAIPQDVFLKPKLSNVVAEVLRDH